MTTAPEGGAVPARDARSGPARDRAAGKARRGPARTRVPERPSARRTSSAGGRAVPPADSLVVGTVPVLARVTGALLVLAGVLCMKYL